MSSTRKTAIVTGASQGIGAGIVKAFVERGFNVVANSRKVTQSTEVVASDHVALVDGHIGEPATAARIVETALSRFKSVDVLVNNGVLVDEWGHSSVRNLYAVGEISCTGVHGANRLASTSLLEGLVWGHRAAQHIERTLTSSSNWERPRFEDVPPWDESGLTAEPDPALIQGDMQTIQNIMWHYVGLVRTGDRLSRAIRELRHLWNEIETFYRTTKLSDGLIGLRNAVEAALIIAQAAQHNRQSRGCHYRQDSVSFEGDRLI